MKYHLIVVLVFGMCIAPCGAEVLQTDTVYQRYAHGYNAFRIPALLSVPGGPLLAFSEGRVWSRWDRGDIDVVLKRSFDGGKTWGPLQLIWSKGEETCGNPTAVYDADTGRIWLLMSNNKNIIVDPTFSSNDAVIRDGQRKVWICYSDDNGATWSTPVDISADVQPSRMQPPSNHWDAMGPGNGIQLRHGPNAGRLVIPAVVRIIYSDDNGQTWTYSELSRTGTNESTVVELSDGRLMRNDRATAHDVYGHFYRRMVCYSYNQGGFWSPYEPQEELITPHCHASFVRYRPSDAAAQSRILFYSGPDSTDERTKMAVKTSKDDGGSWPMSKLIYNDSSAYSSMAIQDDGTISLLFENGDGWPYHRISIARFSYDWLRDTSLVLWDFEEGSPGQTTSILSGRIKDTRGYALHARAQTSFNYVAGAESGKTAIDFQGKNAGIELTATQAQGLIDFRADDSFVIRTVFRTTGHGPDDDPGAIVSRDSGTGNPQWWLRIENGKVRFHFNDGTGATSVWSNAAVNDGQWHSVVVRRDAEHRKLHLYINGQHDITVADTTTGDFINTNNVVVGRFNLGSGRFFEGMIDSVQLMRDPDFTKKGDLNSDGIIDYQDLYILMQNWLVEGYEQTLQ